MVLRGAGRVAGMVVKSKDWAVEVGKEVTTVIGIAVRGDAIVAL